jgi:acetyl esterase
MNETIGQDGASHNKQIERRSVEVRRWKFIMSHILHRVAPIGEARDREILKDASTYIYAQRPEGNIFANLFLPPSNDPKPRPVVIFFHGGFWDVPTPTQFVPQCLHFASRGAVTVAAETRTFSKHGTGALEAIEDARHLIRWLRFNADTLNLDPDKITIGGAGGGAFLALLCAMPKPKNLPPVEGMECAPQALILFSSLVNTVSKGMATERFPDLKTAKLLSPNKLIRRRLPPMLLFHGKMDRITPFEDVDRFRRKMRWWGNTCLLEDYAKAEHSFFNFNFSHKNFESTILSADRFLVDQGLLEPDENSASDG